MLVFAPQDRISAVDALKHPYFQQFGLIPTPSECDQNPLTDLTTTADLTTLTTDNTSDTDSEIQNLEEDKET